MNRFWKAVLLTTLIAGTLDIIAAHVDQTIRTGAFPHRMFYVIAGGAIGLKTALNGGPLIIALGVFIHYFISFSFTLFFFLLYPAISKVSSNKYLNGLLYTIFVWVMMNFIVLPLTALPSRPFVFNIHQVTGFLVLAVVFGTPISLLAAKYYTSQIAEGTIHSRQQAGLI
ncbi:hypothetical protein L3C95_18350 [Chitinophaga filiformis]|uniref:hypothetical protein n=1 Tax=Chitinophaga filiformis TaxID=104663 RepID=UPI001F261FA3|nr:hypothetical protein [Chitinophaga filiformis]MCF6404867.1 hypothetical protein [Chitinophaga filiformis]